MDFQNGSSFQFFLLEEGSEAISNLKEIPEWLEIEVQQPPGNINDNAYKWIRKKLLILWLSTIIALLLFGFIGSFAWEPDVVIGVISITIIVLGIIWAAKKEFKKWQDEETTGIVYITTKDKEGQEHIGKYRWSASEQVSSFNNNQKQH